MEDGQLTAEPGRHYSSEADGRADIEPRLRAWEAAAAIQRGVGFTFHFVEAQVIDRAPTPGEIQVQATSGSVALLGGDARVVEKYHVYPSPPSDHFVATPLVKQLRRNLETIYEGVPLLMVSNLVLTTLIETYGSRDQAADTLKVGRKVLSKLGELSARRHPVEGRKVARAQQPLSPGEDQWVRTLLPMLVMRVGEAAGNGNNLRPITLADLPDL